MAREYTPQSVLYQLHNYGFGISMVFRSKALCEAQGPIPCRAQQRGCGHHRNAFRGGLFARPGCAESVDKAVAEAGPASEASALGLAFETCFAVDPNNLTESAIMKLIVH